MSSERRVAITGMSINTPLGDTLDGFLNGLLDGRSAITNWKRVSDPPIYSKVGADLTDSDAVTAMFDTIRAEFGGLDILVLNASGGMESGMADDYAMKLNRDAQLNLLATARPLLAGGARVVFVTSHQAHFFGTAETMPEYVPVARSKRAGEDALRALIPELAAAGIGFVVVSGDIIEGTWKPPFTATVRRVQLTNQTSSRCLTMRIINPHIKRKLQMPPITKSTNQDVS